MPTYNALPYYNIEPTPQTGTGAYGEVPGAIGIPPSIYQQLGKVAPTLTKSTGPAASYVATELAGTLTPAEQKALQDQAAAWGVQSGQPMVTPGGIATNRWDTSRLLATMQRERQGLADYQSLLQSVGATQTPQAMAAQIAERNAMLAAAPSPEEAARQQIADWEKGIGATAGAGGFQPRGAGRSGVSYSGPFNPYTGQPVLSVSGPAGYTMRGGQQVADTGISDPYAAWYQSTFGSQQFGASPGGGTFALGYEAPMMEDYGLTSPAQGAPMADVTESLGLTDYFTDFGFGG